jgi:hypothetical protein
VGSEGIVVKIGSGNSSLISVDGGLSLWHANEDLAFFEPADYKPSVGDVVSFECDSKTLEAIIYMKYDGELGSVDNTDLSGGYHRTLNRYPQLSFRKIGEVDVSGIDHVTKIRKIAKAYFSKPKQPTFTGTYAERQKQWIEHHGLKVDDKVKVLKKVEKNEGGCRCMASRFLWKADMVGQNYIIRKIHQDGIELEVSGKIPSYPYFALEIVK